ncbi:MAG: hypothetical protein L6Q59_15235 [Ignavibacteriaceae bacterium]|nr:hypothetical protein [Ignavibacteriaceae bacterium]
MVDGDHSEDGKIKPQSKIEAKCKADGALFFQLSKKDIENYCHPDAIRRVLISNIKKVEGEKTQNPKIVQIQQCNIILQDSTDVDKYLKELGICNKFKESKVNLEIFRNMSSTEWQEMDSRDELKNFIESIYRQIS